MPKNIEFNVDLRIDSLRSLKLYKQFRSYSAQKRTVSENSGKSDEVVRDDASDATTVSNVEKNILDALHLILQNPQRRAENGDIDWEENIQTINAIVGPDNLHKLKYRINVDPVELDFSKRYGSPEISSSEDDVYIVHDYEYDSQEYAKDIRVNRAPLIKKLLQKYDFNKDEDYRDLDEETSNPVSSLPSPTPNSINDFFFRFVDFFTDFAFLFAI